jgi:hypothetical protein
MATTVPRLLISSTDYPLAVRGDLDWRRLPVEIGRSQTGKSV